MRPFAKNALTVLVSLAVAFAVAEAGLRALGVSYPEFHRLDADLGWAPRPGVAGWWTREGRAYVRFNSAGFRGPETAPERPPGTYRIVVLGDSFTEARSVAETATFTAVLGRALAACPALSGRRIEALNFGVSGYGPLQELLRFEKRAAAFAPDLVVVATYVGNDVLNGSKALEGHPDRPYPVLRDGVLSVDRRFRDSLRFRAKLAWQGLVLGAVNASAALQLVREGYHRLKTLFSDKAARQAAALGAAGVEEGVFRPPDDPRWAEAWRLTEAVMARLIAEVRAAGARPWLAVFGAPVQVHPDPALRRRLAARLGVADLDYPLRRLRALADRLHVGATALAEPMREAAERDGTYFHGFANTALGIGHWNEKGHAFAGTRIAAELCRRLTTIGR